MNENYKKIIHDLNINPCLYYETSWIKIPLIFLFEEERVSEIIDNNISLKIIKNSNAKQRSPTSSFLLWLNRSWRNRSFLNSVSPLLSWKNKRSRLHVKWSHTSLLHAIFNSIIYLRLLCAPWSGVKLGRRASRRFVGAERALNENQRAATQW